jgi:hypothetical protein
MLSTTTLFRLLALLASSATVTAGDSVSVLGKTWQVAHSNQDGVQHLTEYLLPGDTIDKWRALVTRHHIRDPDSKFQVTHLLTMIRDGFPADCSNFDWSIVRQNDHEALYTWSHDGCGTTDPAEAERALIKTIPGGLCRWSYAMRGAKLDTLNLAQLDGELTNLPCDVPTTAISDAPPPAAGYTRFQIAGVGPMDLPFTAEGARPTADKKAKIEMAGFLVGVSDAHPNQASLIWAFGFTNKSLKNVQSVKVEEVSPSPTSILRVEDSAPVFRSKYWSGNSRPELATAQNHPWLYAEGPSIFVFRFTIQERGQAPRVLYQPTIFSPAAKQQFRAQIEKLNRG